MPTKTQSARVRVGAYVFLLLLLGAIFALPLYDLCAYAISRDLYSHILLIPFISAYLIHTARPLQRSSILESSRMHAGIMVFAGSLALLLYAAMQYSGYRLNRNDALALSVFSFLCFLYAGFFFALGRHLFRRLAFPLLFLLFVVPMPTLMEEGLETLLQVASAHCYAVLLSISGTPFFRHGTSFKLPGLALDVAPQCSGIRSSLVLLITSLLAGHMFLRAGWRKLIMALAFFPISVLRNATRILTITLLTLHVDPTIIDGPVHHRGGPPFFVLSLVPLFLILLLLTKTETKKEPHAH